MSLQLKIKEKKINDKRTTEEIVGKHNLFRRNQFWMITYNLYQQIKDDIENKMLYADSLIFWLEGLNDEFKEDRGLLVELAKQYIEEVI